MLGQGVHVALTPVLFLLLWQEAGPIEVPLDRKSSASLLAPESHGSGFWFESGLNFLLPQPPIIL